MPPLLLIYNKLIDLYGAMGWWPISSSDATPDGYHPGDYTLPATPKERWEIYVGAILTQNTGWKNVRIAINNLIEANSLSPRATIDLSHEELASLIKPSGYFNQKAKKLQLAAKFFIEHDFIEHDFIEHDFIEYRKENKIPTREALLSIWGVGEETADSIRLYAYHQPEFVVDTYTKRIFGFLGILSGKENYQEVKNIFERNLPNDTILFKEYHALIVNHAKQYYNKKPFGKGDPLLYEIS